MALGKKKVDKVEVAQMVALKESGVTTYGISTVVDRDFKTVQKYLNSDVYRDDYDFDIIVQAMKDNKVKDLELIEAKARTRLHEKLDGNEMKPIELIAAMDRSFQQRQILSGGVTENININSFTETSEEREKKIEELKKKLEE